MTRQLVNAARISDSALRWEILLLLTDNDTRKMSQKARDDVFFLASEVNDLALAKWAMSHGAIDMFGFMPDFTSSPTPLSIAVHGDYVEIFRLIMESIDTFVPVTEGKRDQTMRHAYGAACRRNKLEAFLSLVKLQRGMTPEQAFVRAAMVDGASAVVEDLIGRIDIHAASQHVIFAPGDDAGQQALYLATCALRVLNVQCLLKRGCRLRHDATPMQLLPCAREQIESNPTLCRRVVNLLAEYRCTVCIRE